MPTGVLFGLAAALCWGVADFFARGASQRGGTFRTLVVVQVVAVAGFLALGLPTGLLRLGGMAVGDVLLAAALGLAIMAGAGLLYRAFAIGTLALTSPIAASYAAITALLALTLSGEEPRPAQLAGVAVTLGGVALASTVPGHPSAAPKRWVRVGPLRVAPGVTEALAAMLVFGAAYWGLRYPVARLGGVEVAFIAKVGDLVALLAIVGVLVLVGRARPGGRVPAVRLWPEGPRPKAFLLYAVPTSLLDTAANVAYNLGIASSLTSIVSVISSLFS